MILTQSMHGHTVCILSICVFLYFPRLTQRNEEKLEERNKAYYSKFPEDVERVKRIMQYLEENDVSVPSGRLTPARFQQLGLIFGMHGREYNL